MRQGEPTFLQEHGSGQWLAVGGDARPALDADRQRAALLLPEQQAGHQFRFTNLGNSTEIRERRTAQQGLLRWGKGPQSDGSDVTVLRVVFVGDEVVSPASPLTAAAQPLVWIALAVLLLVLLGGCIWVVHRTSVERDVTFFQAMRGMFDMRPNDATGAAAVMSPPSFPQAAVSSDTSVRETTIRDELLDFYS